MTNQIVQEQLRHIITRQCGCLTSGPNIVFALCIVSLELFGNFAQLLRGTDKAIRAEQLVANRLGIVEPVTFVWIRVQVQHTAEAENRGHGHNARTMIGEGIE